MLNEINLNQYVSALYVTQKQKISVFFYSSLYIILVAFAFGKFCKLSLIHLLAVAILIVKYSLYYRI